jgi:hypothetical protein
MRLRGESVASQLVDVIGCTDNIVIGVLCNMVVYEKGKSIICPEQCDSHGLKVSRKARRLDCDEFYNVHPYVGDGDIIGVED